mmetsp:Transcript_67979/g.176896  ORF Transcript_67979/g.176896 Transcript_67979/m.176896 type:complete len:364 (+) Transcript_67979:1091-2182(+)
MNEVRDLLLDLVRAVLRERIAHPHEVVEPHGRRLWLAAYEFDRLARRLILDVLDGVLHLLPVFGGAVLRIALVGKPEASHPALCDPGRGLAGAVPRDFELELAVLRVDKVVGRHLALVPRLEVAIELLEGQGLQLVTLLGLARLADQPESRHPSVCDPLGGLASSVPRDLKLDLSVCLVNERLGGDPALVAGFEVALELLQGQHHQFVPEGGLARLPNYLETIRPSMCDPDRSLPSAVPRDLESLLAIVADVRLRGHPALVVGLKKSLVLFRGQRLELIAKPHGGHTLAARDRLGLLQLSVLGLQRLVLGQQLVKLLPRERRVVRRCPCLLRLLLCRLHRAHGDGKAQPAWPVPRRLSGPLGA